MYPRNVIGCLNSDLLEILWLGTFETSLQRPCATFAEVPLRRLGDVPSRRPWVFHLRLV